MVIDANLYWIPEELFTDQELQDKLLSVIPSRYDWYAHVEEVPGTGKKQFVFEKPQGSPNLNYLQGDYVLEKQLAELNRCFHELGMKNIQLSCHYGDKYLDDPVFAPLFEKLNELKMTAYVHHTPVPVEYEAFKTYNNVRRSYGRVVDQGLAVNRELYSGMFSRYPNVRLVHSFLGGAYYAIAEMMMPHGPAKPQEVARFGTENADIRQQFKDNIFFEMSHAQPWGKRGLEFAVEMLGADHIVFGSSYPVRKEWLLEGPAFVEKLDIPEEEKALLLGGNAQRLYQIEN